MFWIFGPKAPDILAPQPEIKSATPALWGEVLTTGLPAKSHPIPFLREIFGKLPICELGIAHSFVV